MAEARGRAAIRATVALTRLIDADGGRQVALRVEIDQQHPLAELRQRRAEIRRRRGFADPALLIGHGYDGSHLGRRSPLAAVADSRSRRSWPMVALGVQATQRWN